MLLADGWKDYEILDAGDGNKLERWGDVILKRPDPQAIWPMSDKGARYRADATYVRAKTGGGHWQYDTKVAKLADDSAWHINYRELEFIVRPTGFKHVGLFPEQAVNWDALAGICRQRLERAPSEPVNVMNLFAYTGGATCAMAAAGANVVHVDAARAMVAWAKDNAAASGLGDRPIRFIVDDCMKFVLREQRRGRLYEGIVMDPPSYGRGPDGEMWKIEENLYPLIAECVKLLSPRAAFFFVNSYTTGLAPTVIANLINRALVVRRDLRGHTTADELGLPITDFGKAAPGSRGALVLPCGATGRWIAD